MPVQFSVPPNAGQRPVLSALSPATAAATAALTPPPQTTDVFAIPPLWKLREYRIFPTKLVLHIALIAVLTFYISVVLATEHVWTLETQHSIEVALALGQETPAQFREERGDVTLLSGKTPFLEAVHESIVRWAHLSNLTLHAMHPAVHEEVHNAGGSSEYCIMPPVMSVYAPLNGTDHSQWWASAPCTESNPLGLFSKSAVRPEGLDVDQYLSAATAVFLHFSIDAYVYTARPPVWSDRTAGLPICNVSVDFPIIVDDPDGGRFRAPVGVPATAGTRPAVAVMHEDCLQTVHAYSECVAEATPQVPLRWPGSDALYASPPAADAPSPQSILRHAWDQVRRVGAASAAHPDEDIIVDGPPDTRWSIIQRFDVDEAVSPGTLPTTVAFFLTTEHFRSKAWTTIFVSAVCTVCAAWGFVLRLRAVQKWFRRRNMRMTLLGVGDLYLRNISLAVFLFADAWALAAGVTGLIIGALPFQRGYNHMRLRYDPLRQSEAFMFGWAAFCAWIVFLAYFKFYPRWYLLLKSLMHGMPQAVLFLIGCFPFFLAYAIFGTVVFGSHCPLFATLTDSCLTLFAVLNGDSIHDVFSRLMGTRSRVFTFVGLVYLFSFVGLFIYAILNVFLAIMETAYVSINQEVKAEEAELRQLRNQIRAHGVPHSRMRARDQASHRGVTPPSSARHRSGRT
eukprot:TRINITY_DN20637_c0_g1_i1.p1 TRINITY_DN20637_c0_g1~~TRINITY_DN20637_c0_g1_i1.p1  ORF type:complete len:680 (+),score=113.28 TRINITY_DN20637_c0_g1_i1:335-2374(+)